MSDGRKHSALREWRAHLMHPLTLTALGGASVVLALVGPFGTYQTLSLAERLTYWSFLTIFGYALGYLANWRLVRSGKTAYGRTVPKITAGLVTGILMAGLATTLNWGVFGLVPSFAAGLKIVGTSLCIAVVVTFVIDAFFQHLSLPPAARTETLPDTPFLVTRLALENRGPLVAISVEDHYVRVRTTKGEEMILMRLADAMREVGQTRGAQVHRSHWAAFDHVTSVTRSGERAVLQMTVGGDIPVSRRHIPTLKEAGLLPR